MRRGASKTHSIREAIPGSAEWSALCLPEYDLQAKLQDFGHTLEAPAVEACRFHCGVVGSQPCCLFSSQSRSASSRFSCIRRLRSGTG